MPSPSAWAASSDGGGGVAEGDRMPWGGFGDACKQLELNFIAAGFFDDDLAFGQTRQSQALGQIGINDCQLPSNNGNGVATRLVHSSVVLP